MLFHRFDKGDNTNNLLFAIMHNGPLKTVYSRREEFAPVGANSFLLEMAFFLKSDAKAMLTEFYPLKMYPFTSKD